jgi:hypothetical protein|tara:strand:- start:1950 stop:2213 length:264 start_codon:yes stop_codon:yes gene_type:complete
MLLNKQDKKRISKKIQALKIKKIKTMQGQYLSMDNGLIVRVNGIKFPMVKGDRYLMRDTARAVKLALKEYEQNININNPKDFIGDYL